MSGRHVIARECTLVLVELDYSTDEYSFHSAELCGMLDRNWVEIRSFPPLFPLLPRSSLLSADSELR